MSYDSPGTYAKNLHEIPTGSPLMGTSKKGEAG